MQKKKANIKDLVRVSGISTYLVLIVDIGNSENLLGLYLVVPPNCDNGVLSYRHRQHRIALIVYVLSDQVHSPCHRPITQNQKHIHRIENQRQRQRYRPGERANS